MKREFKINDSGISGWIEASNGSSNNFICYNDADILKKDTFLQLGWDFTPSKAMEKLAKSELIKFHRKRISGC